MSPVITVWYGHRQRFGHLGEPQRWVNVLGNITPIEGVLASCSLNGTPQRLLSLGCDLHRLAGGGDFNIELPWDELREGDNTLTIVATATDGSAQQSNVVLVIERGRRRPLPCHIDFSQVSCLQDVVQVVDGDWRLVEDGVRTATPYYDRVLSLGDPSWSEVDVLVRLTVHDFTPPASGPPTYQVTHMGLALRWRGHHVDDEQPHRKWYPLGAQGEFLLQRSPEQSRWRILFGPIADGPAAWSAGHNAVHLDRPMWIRAQVFTLADGGSRYRFKQWHDGVPEPGPWDVEGVKANDLPGGSVCLVPHNSDVTIHEISVQTFER